MSKFKPILSLLFLTCSLLSGTEFTVCSYNCGGLSDHYDYLRAAVMQKLMQERANAEPELMDLNDKIQKVALKKLFNGKKNDYPPFPQQVIDAKINASWNEKWDATISHYKVRPVIISDNEIMEMIDNQLRDLTGKTEGDLQERLSETRSIMAQRIFNRQLKYDILCLQEADYLNSSLFPSQFDVLFDENTHSKNGIAWNKDRFEWIETIGNLMDRAFIVKLVDKDSKKTILVASAHLTGCDPYQVQYDPETKLKDSAKGDKELKALLQLFSTQSADFKIIGMDSNVTSLHPRMRLLKKAGILLDAENHLEPTCSNSYFMLNTRIDWIGIQSDSPNISIVNIPLYNIGLNSIQTNISDHKPIAAKISDEN